MLKKKSWKLNYKNISMIDWFMTDIYKTLIKKYSQLWSRETGSISTIGNFVNENSLLLNLVIFPLLAIL